jgi:hypothetical protein
MTRTNRSLVLICAFCAILFVALFANGQQSTAISYRVYHVTDAANFPGLPMTARSLILLNGVVLTPNIDYSVSGSTFRISGNCGLQNGDVVTVVSIP